MYFRVTDLFGSHTTSSEKYYRLQKVFNCLFGQIGGDAYGTTREFQKPTNTEFTENITGGGPFNLNKGQITDDSELALGLLHVFFAEENWGKNRFELRELVAKKYIEWYNSVPFDIGNATKNAFSKATDFESICRNSKEKNMNSLSNGCLMKISPLAIYGYLFGISDTELAKFAEDICIMTNPNPIAIDASIVYVLSVRKALICNSRREIYEYAREVTKTTEVKEFLNEADLFFGESKNINVYDDMGYIRHAIVLTFGELLYGKSFIGSMKKIIKFGGDTDTNCCIAGALLAPIYEEYAIPQQWYDILMKISSGVNYTTGGNRFLEYPNAMPSAGVKLLVDFFVKKIEKFTNLISSNVPLNEYSWNEFIFSSSTGYIPTELCRSIVNMTNSNGKTVLYTITLNHNIQVFNSLIEYCKMNDKCDFNNKNYEGGNTPLIGLALGTLKYNLDIEIFNDMFTKMLKLDANKNIPNNTGLTFVMLYQEIL